MKRFGWMWGLLLGLCLVGGLAAPGSGESPTEESLIELREIAVEPRDGGLAVQIKMSGPAAYQTSLIDTPTRLVIDLESTSYAGRKTPLAVDMDPLRQIRGSQFKKGVARVVLELTRTVGYRIEEGPEGLTVVLEPSSTAAALVKAQDKPTEVAKAEPSPQEVKPAEVKPSAEAAPPAPKAEAPKPVEPPAGAKTQPQEAEAKKETKVAAPQAEVPRPAAVSPAPLAPKPAATPPPIRLAQTAQTPPAPNGSRLISLDFKDADILNILRILAAESGRNIVTGDDVRGKISISLHNVPWEVALDTVLEAKGLQKLEKDNVMRIVSTEQLTKEREAKAKAQDAIFKTEADWRTKLAEAQLKETQAQHAKFVAEAAIEEAKARGPLTEETIRLKYADPEEVAKTLQGILGIPEGGAPAAGLAAQPGVIPAGATPGMGLGGPPPIAMPPFSALYGPQAGAPTAPGAVGAANAEVLFKGLTIRANKATNSLFLRLYKNDLDRVKKLISESLDIPLPQVRIEARLELLSRVALEEIGVQWGGAAAGRDGSNVLVGQGFTGPAPAARTTGTAVTGVTSPITNPAATLANLLPVSATTGLPIGGNLVNLPFTGSPAFPSAAGGFNFGIIGTNFNVNLAIQALEAQQKSRQLARPDIVTIENKPAQISFGEEIPYATVSSAGTQIQFKEAVLALTVTPTVIREGDITKIKMKVIVENNSRGLNVDLGGAGNVPAIDKRRAETEVIVKEGEILVIGGVKQRTDTETVQKVPLFGDIPIFGWLFKTRKREIFPDRELVIFIAPSIVKGGSPYPSSTPIAVKPKGP